ncbi:hypothetical protein B4900_03200 [Yersinia rohdei]|nr:hypothetical protein B4900_03200 [Yersinia rohdei]
MTNRKHRDNRESKAGSLRRRGELVEPFVEVPVSISTKAKHLALMKAIMRAAERDWKWIDNFRFHDLRHTWASWLVQAGVPLSALQEMGGWESIEMVQRYAPLAPRHLSAHAKQIDSIFDGHVPNSSHGDNLELLKAG